MALSPDIKKKVISEFAINENDTGSTVVQVALLTKRIDEVTEHLKQFPHDFASKQGLLRMVSKRRTYLKHLQQHVSPVEYATVLQKLELKK